ncbi:DUF1684 domain-containing protein [Actinokineospora bangkokensis]|uniref:DUF1684 domain-containing protein n=1 Tax=Actinokineospora bangkokensis TaxID=1193682 RepID=A0A1Q9LKC4_9PSEU|nr:DUF1684 domain-containing protein [Actinokineospora bangkokensis]OLR92470.1 hypothetical protein BJP25_20545 [Actinokineospora bangkokensis]
MSFETEWRQWKAEREEALVEPHGWLALVSLDWLGREPRAHDGVPGLWWQDDEAAYLDPQGAELEHDGVALTGVTRFELVNSGAGTRVLSGDVEIEVARRSGYLIRVHDPKAEALRAFHGVPSYDPAESWVVEARYEPFDEPVPTTVGAVVEGLTHVYQAPGRVRFTRDGREHALTAFNGTEGGLSILFTDETSGVTTYGANRSLKTTAPDPDGRVLLDFNRAVNLPCAFTPYATCPLPPEGNRLPFPVEAGEKTPHEAV